MLAPFLQLPPPPGPLGAPTPLPSPVPARVAKAETWRIQPVATPRQPAYDPEKTVAVVAGKRIVLRTSDAWNRIEGVQTGRDGSVLVHRASINDPRWAYQDFIWYEGKETAIDGADFYLDRHNYAGSQVRDTNAMGMPESAPEAHVVRNGRSTPLGWGSIRAWTPDGTFVLEVPVGEEGQPTGTEFTTGAVTRIVSNGKEWRVRDYGYLGREKDGTIVLASGATSSSVGGGFVSLSKRAVSSDRILFWRGGRFVAHVALPDRWRIAGLAPDGRVLVRRAPVFKEPPLPNMQGMTSKETFAVLDQIQKAEADADTRAERDWTAGFLKGGMLTPVVFGRPKGTERLLWRGGATAFGPRAFRFVAFWGDDERTFRVSPS